MKKIALLFSILLSVGLLSAQELTLSGQIRPRTEYLHGFASLIEKNTDPAVFTLQRSRLNVFYYHSNYDVKFVLQDIRTWGSTSQLNTSDNFLAVHEAWAKLKLSKKVGLKFGRQEIAYDDQRIFGSVDWAQQARSHDALLLTVNDSTWKFHVGLAYNQNAPTRINTPFTVPRNYKTMQYLWFHKDWAKVGWSILALNTGSQVVTATDQYVNFIQTLGTRLSWKADKLSGGINFYYQTGKDAVEANTNIQALNTRAEFNYKFSGQFSGSLGGEYLSGNDQSNPNDKNNAFNPLFGTNHKFNGLMDYFYVGNHLGNVGLVDLFGGIKFKRRKKVFALQAHLFQSDGDILNPANQQVMEKGLGMELDFTSKFQIKKDIKLQFGYSQLFATESMEILKGGDRTATTNWAWVMIDIRPTFLKWKKK